MSKVDRVFDEAFDVIEERFEDFGDVELHEDEKAGSDNGAGSERQFAYCKDGDPLVIAFAPKAEQLPLNRLRGLMRHELGHALEYRYGVAELEDRLGVVLPDGIERRADAIAEVVWGEPVVYDERLVQCVGCTGRSPRPKHLPEERGKLRANAARHGDWYGPVYRAQPRDFGLHGGSLFWADRPRVTEFGTYVIKARVRMGRPYLGRPDDLQDVLAELSSEQAREIVGDLGHELEPDPLRQLEELLEEEDGVWQHPSIVTAMRRADFDGVIARDPHGGETEYVVFSPEQVEVLDTFRQERGKLRANPDPKTWSEALAFAKLLKRAGTSYADAKDRIAERYGLGAAAMRSLARTVWGVRENPPPGKTFTAYHASTAGMPDAPAEFRSFRGMDYGPGFYLGTDSSDLEQYGDRLYEATVRLNNPIVISRETPPDPELLAWLQRALRISDDDLGFYPHPMVGVFALALTLVQMGEISPQKLIAALQKRGYDGVYIDGDIVNEHQSMGLKGDYLAIWDPGQILSWEEQRQPKANPSGARYLFDRSCPAGPVWWIEWVTDEGVSGYDDEVDWADIEADLRGDPEFDRFMREWVLHPAEDTHVTYYRTTSPTGVPLIVVQHSGIEHIWAEQSLDLEAEEREAERQGFWYLEPNPGRAGGWDVSF